MTARNINNQIVTIKAVTKEASSSKEAAIAFLRKAGIIEEEKKTVKVVSALPAKVRSGWRVSSKEIGAVSKIGIISDYNQWPTRAEAVEAAKEIASKGVVKSRTTSRKS